MRISDWSSDVCSSDLRDKLHEGLEHARNLVADGLTPSAADVGDLIVQCGRAMSMLRGGRLPDTASGIYTPVTTEPLHRMPADPYLADSGVCQFAAAAALIGLGIDRGHWTATPADTTDRSEEHTSELQSLMRISYAVLCLKKKKKHK